MANLAIRGHETRGKEVIEILEMLGGKNKYLHLGESESYFFFIQDGVIDCDEVKNADDYIIFTIEQFLEKFPYKVGDKVSSKYLKNYKIEKMEWKDTNNRVIYKLQGMGWYAVNELQPYKEETMEEIIKIDIPKGYEFVGIDDDNQQVVFEKIGCQYPKTYEECCSLIGVAYPYMKIEDNRTHASCYKGCQIAALIQLLICRDAYWKIAGEQMGLGKPWEPDWAEDISKYTIEYNENEIKPDEKSFYLSKILAFPTRDMRDAFYENFKDLINDCKELL